MNVVDSSGWLEYFANGPNADFFALSIEDSRRQSKGWEGREKFQGEGGWPSEEKMMMKAR